MGRKTLKIPLEILTKILTKELTPSIFDRNIIYGSTLKKIQINQKREEKILPNSLVKKESGHPNFKINSIKKILNL